MPLMGMDAVLFTLSFDRLHRILRLKFTDLLTAEDLDKIDPRLLSFLGSQGVVGLNARCLYDMTEVSTLIVPQRRFVVRASKPAIGNMMRVVVAPSWAGATFGESYRSARGLWSHDQPTIVESLDAAYALLEVSLPNYEPLQESTQ
jgi:hypothetical protein